MIRHDLPTVAQDPDLNMQLLWRLQIRCEIQVQTLRARGVVGATDAYKVNALTLAKATVTNSYVSSTAVCYTHYLGETVRGGEAGGGLYTVAAATSLFTDYIVGSCADREKTWCSL